MSVVANVAINVDSRNAVSKLRQVQQGAQATSQAVDKLNATNDALAASFTKSGKPIQTAANGMRYFVDAAGRARKENGQFVTTAEAAAAGLRKQGQAAQQASASVSNLGGTVRALLGSFALIQSARFVFVKTAELESQARSLQILAGSAEKAQQIIKELQQLGAVTPFTSTELIDSAKRLQAFGVEADKVVETTRRLADASGATGAELSGLVTAYGQVQAKGRLQGEELLQFQERGIALQEELRKMYGMTGEEFQKALSKGQISAKAVEAALVNLTNAGGKYANGAIAQSDTLNGRFSTLQDGIEGIARTIGTALTPAIKAVLNEAIFAVNAINQLIATGARAKSFGLGQGQRQQILKQAQDEAADIVNRRRIRNPFERNRQFQDLAAQRERDLIEAFGIRTGQVKPQATAPQMSAAVPTLAAPTTGAGGGKGRSAANRAGEQTARIQAQVQGLQRQTELTKQLTFLQEQIANAEAVRDQQLVIRLQGEEKLLQLQYQLADALADAETTSQRKAAFADAEAKADQIRVGTAIELSKNEEERQKRFEELLTGLDREIELNGIKEEAAKKLKQIEFDIIDFRKQGILLTDAEADAYRRRAQAAAATEVKGPAQQRMEELQKSLATLTNQEQIAVAAADNIGQAFGNAFQDIITGAASGQEALANMMKSIGENFVNMAAQIIAQQMTMIILGTIMKALGIGGGGLGSMGGGGGFGSFSGGSFGVDSTGLGGGLAGAGALGTAPSAMSYAGVAMRANGGPVAANAPYVVGERGPELFVPSSNGSVVSNQGLREAMNYSSGGANAPVLNMSFETTTIGNVEYVSRDQLEAAMAETRRQASRDGAQRGMTMTLDRIQQSPQTRSRLGLR